MALMEEKEAVKHERKQLETVNEILKTVTSLDSKKLDLSRRRIKDFPTELNSLKKLEFLYLEGNSLTCLPDDFFICLPLLKWLDLRNNQITYLPTTIGEARCLRSLLLEDNKITKLPLELGFVQSLSGLHLAGNPLEFPPPNIKEQGVQVILAFLRDEWLKMHKDDNDFPTDDEADKKEHDEIKPERRRHRCTCNHKDRIVERRNSDPSRPPAQLFEDGTGLLNIASTVLSKPAGKRRVKSYSASKLGRSHGMSNPETTGGMSAGWVKGKASKDMLTHNMKRMSTGLLRRESAESKMQEEMKRAEEKIKNAKINAVIQQRKNKEELDGWRKETQRMQRKKYLEAARQGLKFAPSPPPFGTHDQKFKATTKHGDQVHDALENLDASSLMRMTRDREILDRIDEQMKKLRSKKPTLEEVTPMEEVEAARKNLEEALKLHNELKERRALEYRLRAFTGGDYAPSRHAKLEK